MSHSSRAAFSPSSGPLYHPGPTYSNNIQASPISPQMAHQLRADSFYGTASSAHHVPSSSYHAASPQQTLPSYSSQQDYPANTYSSSHAPCSSRCSPLHSARASQPYNNRSSMAGLTQNLSTAGMQLLTHIAHCVDNATEDVENLRQMVRDLFQDMKDLQERSRHRDAVLRNKLNEVRFSNDQVCKASLDAFHRLLSRVDDMCEAEERHRRWTDLTLASLESKIVQRLQSSMPLGSASPRQGMWHKPQARHSLKHEAYTHDDGDHAEAEDTSNGADGVYTNGQVSPTQRHLSKRCRRQDSLSNSHPEAIEVRSSQSSGSSPEQHKDDHVGNDVTTATTTTDSTNTLLIAVHGCGQAHEDAIAPESCQGTSPLFAKEKKDEEAEDGDDEEEDDEDDEDYVDGDHEEEKVDTSKAPKPTKRSSRRQSLRLKNSFK